MILESSGWMQVLLVDVWGVLMILESSGWMQVLLVDVWVSVSDFRE